MSAATDLPFDEDAAEEWYQHEVAPFERDDDAPAAFLPRLADRIEARLGDAEPWEWDDVAAILAGELVLETPSIMFREDGRGLLYAGRLHAFQGEDANGKTWIALVGAVAVLKAGGVVWYFNWDDTAAAMIVRLRLLGATDDEIARGFRHKSQPGPLGPEIIDQLVTEIPTDGRVCLVIVDVVGEAMAEAGFDEDKNPEYLKWATRVVRPLLRAGATVLLCDHVVKNPDNRGYARGAGAKRGTIDGAAYEVTAPEPLAVGRGGTIRLTIRKDRHGGVGPRGEIATNIRFIPNAAGGYDVRILPPFGEQIDGTHRTVRAGDLSRNMATISDLIVEHAGVGVTALRTRAQACSVSERSTDAALNALTDEGWIRVETKGNGRAKEHYPLIPYRAERDPRSTAYRATACADWLEVKGTDPYPPSLGEPPE